MYCAAVPKPLELDPVVEERHTLSVHSHEIRDKTRDQHNCGKEPDRAVVWFCDEQVDEKACERKQQRDVDQHDECGLGVAGCGHSENDTLQGATSRVADAQ